MNKYDGYEVISIPASTDLSKWTVIEDDWMVCADGINKTAYQVNRKTGEIKYFSYEEALKAIFE